MPDSAQPEVLGRFAPMAGVPLSRQIAGFLREAITAGRLPPTTPLPSTHTLAAQWGTSYFTVHSALAMLVDEGLLCRKPRLGTFVREREQTLTSVGIYHSGELALNTERAFATNLHALLYNRLRQEQIAVTTWLDRRDFDDQGTPPAELLEAIEQRRVQAIIVTQGKHPNLSWFPKLPLPFAISASTAQPGQVALDSDQMLQAAVDQLVARGCHQVGFITHERVHPDRIASGDFPTDHSTGQFIARARRAGLEVRPEWIRCAPVYDAPMEHFGYDAFHSLWQQPNHPDGLFVYPDTVGRGLFTAMLESGVTTPGDLRLVMHRNAELPLFCPFAIDWLVYSMTSHVEALLDTVRRQLAGAPRSRQLLPVTLETAETSPIALASQAANERTRP